MKFTKFFIAVVLVVFSMQFGRANTTAMFAETPFLQVKPPPPPRPPPHRHHPRRRRLHVKLPHVRLPKRPPPPHGAPPPPPPPPRP